MSLDTIKLTLDAHAGLRSGKYSWLDTHFDGEAYTMPFSDEPALRYSYMTFGDQRDVKLKASKFRDLLQRFHPEICVQPHLTRSEQGTYYWKVEAFLPLYLFE